MDLNFKMKHLAKKIKRRKIRKTLIQILLFLTLTYVIYRFSILLENGKSKKIKVN